MASQCPRLARLLAECTQQHRHRNADLHRRVEEYLADEEYTDLVYLILLEQAQSELISYTPSLDVIISIESFCSTIRTAPGVSPGVRQSVAFLQSLVAHVASDAPERPASSAASGPGRASSVASSEFRLRRRAAPAHARIASDTAILHPPQDLDGLGGTRRAASTPGTRPPHTYQEGGVHGSAEAPWGEAHTQAHPLGGSTRSSVPNVHQDSALQSLLQQRWPSGGPPAQLGSPGVAAKLLGDIPNQSSLTFTTGAGPSIAPALPPIKALLRKDALLAPSGAGTRLRGARAPILFDHAPYSLQSRLELRPEDVAAVVEAVVGPEPGGVPLWEDPEALWRDPPWVPGGLPPRSIGETCSAILVKLIIDAWLRMPGGQCLALVLSMLATGLVSHSPAAQCRVFDLLVNLHVHAELLFAQPPSDVAGEAVDEQAGGPAVVEPPHPSPAVRAGRIDAFRRWLCLLLFQSLSILTEQHDDIDERVWTSAFGCLVALLCDHEGALDPADLGALPPSALAALAEAAAGHRWPLSACAIITTMVVGRLYCCTQPYATVHDVLSTTGGLATQGAVGGADEVNASQPADDAMTHAPADAAVVVGGTPLDRAALCAMGGVHFAVEQLKKASAAVTRRAWLAVVMDAVCGGPADPADDADAAENDAAAVHAALLLLTAPGVLDAVHLAFCHGGLCFRTIVSHALQRAAQQPQDVPIYVIAALERASQLIDPLQPHPPLQPAMTASIQYVLDGAWEDEGAGSPRMGGPWEKIRGLLHSEDAVARQRGRGWLLDVLVHASAASLQGLDDGQWRAANSLLPGPPSQRGSYDGQLHDGMFGRLQDMLQLLLTRAPACLSIAADWVAVVGRWLMWVLWVGIPSHHHGGGQSREVIRGTARSGASSNEPLDVPSLMFATLLAAVEWVEACSSGQQAACIELGQVLLAMLVVTSGDARRSSADGARVGRVPTVSSSSMASALLHGVLAVPDALLRKVPLLLLLKLFKGNAPEQQETLHCTHLGDTLGAVSTLQEPDQVSDLRVAMLLLIIGRVMADPDKLIGGNNFFTQLFSDSDPRVRHYASCLVLHRLMSQPDSRERYMGALRQLVSKAALQGDVSMVANPYRHISTMIDVKFITC